jgi:glycosyltransferase involved in cell wall biosynthesis
MSVQEEKIDSLTLVSIVITCYNGAVYLAEAIESILNQTYCPIEIILVNDGSTDRSLDVVAGYPMVRTISQSNQGVAKARNRGLQDCQGEFVVFLDQDDRLLPEAIAIGVKNFRLHPECGFVFGQARIINADGSLHPQATATTVHDYYATYDYSTLLLGRGNICPPSTVLFRREVLHQVGGFDATFGLAEDYDMYLKIAQRYAIAYHPLPVTEYRQYEDNYPARKILQLRTDVQAVFQAQQTYIDAHPDSKKNYRRGKIYWRFFWEGIMVHFLLKRIRQGDRQEARQLWTRLSKSPTSPLATIFYLISMVQRFFAGTYKETVDSSGNSTD